MNYFLKLKFYQWLVIATLIVCAFIFFHKNKNKITSQTELFNLKFRNGWQIQETSTKGTLHLLNAYLDDRQINTESNFVRILAMSTELNLKEIYCDLWYEKVIITVRGSFLWIWKSNWEHEDRYQPYLISCPTENTKIPKYVSVFEDLNDTPTNKLKINYEKVAAKKDFVVCVKGLDFPFEDKSSSLVEWIELLMLLGAEKIHFYEYSVDKNIEKVLNYYKKQNHIDVTVLGLVGDFSNLPLLQQLYLHGNKVGRRFQEVITFNDCLYRYLNEFKYVVSLDTDEILVPVNGTWYDLMAELRWRNGIKDSYLGRNVYFFNQFIDNSSDIPDYFHILRHIRRAKEHSPVDHYVKGFHNTETVKALYNHMPLWCLNKDCKNMNIDLELAQLQNYRKDCVKEISNCDKLKNSTVEDTRIWRFKEELVMRVTKVLADLESLDS